VILEPLHGRLLEELGHDGATRITEAAKKWGLPCGSCRKGERDASHLAGLRLGRHERRILLFAPPGSKCGWRDGPGKPTFPSWGKIVYPDGPSRAAEEANRRALRKLERAGLVELGRQYTWGRNDKPPAWFEAKQERSRYWRMGRKYRTARLTPLGELVVERCRHELETGKPIRWPKLLAGLAADVHRSRSELFRQFGMWFSGGIFRVGLGAALTQTSEDKERARRKQEALKRLQAFVFEQASKPEGAA
jgi:hypothetical protein